MAKLYMAYNGPMQTTAAPTPVATANPKTLLQLQPTSGRPPIRVVEWGISFDGTAVNTPIRVELIDTSTVAATVTAYVTADITKYTDPNAPNSTVTLGTSASGYTATAEGTITSVRTMDLQLISPTGNYVHQFPLGREPEVAVGNNLRVRVSDGGTNHVNAYTYVIWEE